MAILVRTGGGNWKKAEEVRFGNEADLQKMLYESPELISSSNEKPAIFIREAGLPGSGYTDLLGVDAEGNVLIVETKLAKNSEIRRKVIGQIFEYAAYLWKSSFEELDHLFRTKSGKSIRGLLSDKGVPELPNDFDETVSANLKSGHFSLLIAVDEMNEELEHIIAYLSSRGPGLQLQALELRTYKIGDTEILAPQRHGEPIPSHSEISSAITIDEALANCPDDHSRKIFKGIIDLWRNLGHEVKPGRAGVSLRAKVKDSMQYIFWSFPDYLQGAFDDLLRKGAPSKVVEEFRLRAANLKGFDHDKFMKTSQPIVKFSDTSEDQIAQFMEEADKVVREWNTSAASTPLNANP